MLFRYGLISFTMWRRYLMAAGEEKKYGFILMTLRCNAAMTRDKAAIRSYGLADVAFSCNIVSLDVI